MTTAPLAPTQPVDAIWIRHGQSTANVGGWNERFAEIPLTTLGQQQAEALAASWAQPPGLIVHSPYLRTRQTAQPTIARFPHVPVEVWPIQEFTYWDRAHWGGSTPEAETDAVTRYWASADADHRQGGTAESFAHLIERARTALARLQSLAAQSPVLLFTHGHFLQALRCVVWHPESTPEELMLGFRAFDEANKIRNTQLVRTHFDGHRWHILPDPHPNAGLAHLTA